MVIDNLERRRGVVKSILRFFRALDKAKPKLILGAVGPSNITLREVEGALSFGGLTEGPAGITLLLRTCPNDDLPPLALASSGSQLASAFGPRNDPAGITLIRLASHPEASSIGRRAAVLVVSRCAMTPRIQGSAKFAFLDPLGRTMWSTSRHSKRPRRLQGSPGLPEVLTIFDSRGRVVLASEDQAWDARNSRYVQR